MEVGDRCGSGAVALHPERAEHAAVLARPRGREHQAAIATRQLMRQDSRGGPLTMMPFLLETPTGNTVWVLIALGGATILYALFRPSMRGKRADPLERSPLSTRLAQQRNTERQMESLLVELSEMARQISAQLDTRSQKLELLIQ